MKSFRLSVLIAIALALIIGTGVSVQAGSGEKNTSPSVNGKYDLGTSTRAWKDLRITGSVYSDGVAVIADGVIAGTALAANSVSATEIADSTITATQMAANSVAASEIVDSTITTTQMAVNSVDSAEIVANSVTASEAFINTISVTVENSATSGTATVTAGSVILGVYGFANIDDGREFVNSVSISSTTLTLAINGTASGAVVYKVPVMEP